MIKDINNVKRHLMKDQKYPATREELVAECDDLSDFSMEDKEWFKSNLPAGTFKSADEVMKALNMDMTGMGMM